VIVSEHDKILLADGRRALIGGRNIAADYFTPPADDPEAFADTDVVISGPSLGAALEEAFDAEYESGEAKEVEWEEVDLKDSTADLLLAYSAMSAWLHDDPIPPETEEAIRKEGLPWLDELRKMPHLKGALRKTLPPTVEAEVRLLDSRTRLGAPDDFITRSLIRLVRSARREIFIQSPYLVLPEDAVNVLREAGRRGVRITILTNSALSTDNPMSQAVFLEQWPELMARVPGLRIFVAGDRHNLHGKLAVFDRTLTIVGTYNLDPLSIAYNSELAAAVWSPPFAEALVKSRESLLKAGAPRILQYTIARSAKGEPKLGEEGEVEVKFGPEDHLGADERSEAERYRKVFRWTWGLTPKAPFF
jgi:phosphatidylserine/phosphatidylglycerophosphate/cardiolipin synthase-like enzyme